MSRAYRAPFAFTGGTIAQVIVDVSGAPYVDVERELAAAFAKTERNTRGRQAANMSRLAIGSLTLALLAGCDRTTSGTASEDATSSPPTATT